MQADPATDYKSNPSRRQYPTLQTSPWQLEPGRQPSAGANNPPYRWLDNLQSIELASSIYGEIGAARATALLNQEAYKYFSNTTPNKWGLSNFEDVTARPCACLWALGQVIADPVFKLPEAKKAAKRCKV